MPTSSLHPLPRWAAPAAALLLAGALGACASKSPPAEPALAAGATAVETARSAGAPEFAAGELNTARTKLERARALAQSGNQKEALRLAEQAAVDAELARAVAASERSRRSAAELDASLRTLREELNRSSTTPALPAAPARTQ